MKMESRVHVHAIKESLGEFEGRAFTSTTFHLDVDLKENSVGRGMGKVTRPFKFGDATEYDKWAHLANSLPILVLAEFDMEATKDGTRFVLVGIRPVQQKPAA